MTEQTQPPQSDSRRVADVLAKLALEVLDAERDRTGVDEWDESDIRCCLYDAAHAWTEGDVPRILEYER